MTNILNIMSRFLPRRFKAIIRPFYFKFLDSFKRSDILSTIGIKSVAGFEVAYRKWTTDEIAIDYCLNDDIYFLGIPEYQSAAEHVIIDIGAHIGAFSLLASSKARRGKVYAIEPSEDAFNMLHINVALNNATNISMHHTAISDEPGTCRLYFHEDLLGHSTVGKNSRGYEMVNCCTLADFFDSNNIDKCHYMKINCEGAEFPILLSTPINVLRRCELILVLYHCDQWTRNTEIDLLSHLQSAGFSTIVRNKSEKRGWIVARWGGEAHDF